VEKPDGESALQLCSPSRLYIVLKRSFNLSGKSTQLPSFILESHLARGLPCKILVTEPRRISAISLADRVSKELGDTGVGGSDGQGSLVGYSIRLENKIGKNTVSVLPLRPRREKRATRASA
jgi:hypothetical protein